MWQGSFSKAMDTQASPFNSTLDFASSYVEPGFVTCHYDAEKTGIQRNGGRHTERRVVYLLIQGRNHLQSIIFPPLHSLLSAV